MSTLITSAMVEAAAREMCFIRECGDPDRQVRLFTSDPGRFPEPTGETMPYWKWKYEGQARRIILAALGDGTAQHGGS